MTSIRLKLLYRQVIINILSYLLLFLGDVGKFTQEQLETVIPSANREMLILNGAYRGEIAELEKILEDKFLLRLRISEGTRQGRFIEVPYEDASKLA